MSQKEFHGIIIYTIEKDGCLNGVYTNYPNDGDIHNEVAKRKINTPPSKDDLSGEYDCFYFDIDNSRNNAELTISIVNGRLRTYKFLWEINKKPIFEGIGYKMNEKQVAIHYWAG